MSFRRRPTRALNSKAKDTTSQTLQDVVSQVIRDVSAIEDQHENAAQNLNPDTDHDEAAQLTQCAVVGLEAGDYTSNKRNFGKRRSCRSITPLPSQQLINDSQCPRTTESFRSHLTDDQPNQNNASGGGQAEDTEIGPTGNVWISDPLLTELAQVKADGTNDVGDNQKGTSGRPSLTPPPNTRTFPAESLDRPRRLQRLQNQVHENDGEALKHGFLEDRHRNPSELDDDEFDEREEEEEEEEEEDRPPGQHRSQGGITEQWSNDIPFDEMEEVEIRDSEGKRGKKGGKLQPRHVWSLRPGTRFVVPFNSLDQPVRKGGFLLVRFLGDIAKNCELCPIGEANWHRVDKSCKANIIALIREKFVIPDRREIDKYILRHVGNKWRNYRHKLKSKFKQPNKTQDQVASIVPKSVPPNQWVKLVQYWFSEKCKMLSSKGKESRAAQTHFHVTGSKSFARRRDEFEKTHGREPGALEWFLETHKRQDGTFVKDISKEFVDTAAGLIAQRGSTSSHHTPAVENQVFSELMYSDDEQLYQKRPLGYGFGVTGNKLYGVEAESRKRGYIASGIKPETGSSKKKKEMIYMEPERGNTGNFPLDSNAELDRLNFGMIAMGESNQLMQSQIKMQSKQLRKQSQQLQMQTQQMQMQSKQIEGLQVQLQQVTSLLTKFGAMLKNPQAHHLPQAAFSQGINGANRQVPYASSDYSDEESDSTDWDSDQ